MTTSSSSSSSSSSNSSYVDILKLQITTNKLIYDDKQKNDKKLKDDIRWLDDTIKWYSDEITHQLFVSLDRDPELISRIKHRFLSYIASNLDRIAPDKFTISTKTVDAGTRCIDIDSRWKYEFPNAGTIPVVKNAHGVVDKLAKMFFAHVIYLAKQTSCIPLVDERQSGDRLTSVDCAMWVKDTSHVITVECKTIQRSLNRKYDSYLLHCGSPKTMGVCDSYFVILWKTDVNTDTVFRDVVDFLSNIRRVVFITRAELARAKKLQQSGCRLTLSRLQLDPLQGHNRPPDVKKTKEKLQVLVGTEDVDYVSIENRHKLATIIVRWALSLL